MQRYFIDQAYQPSVEISGEAHHHMSRVMRMTVDDQVFLVFNDKTAVKAKIVTIDNEKVTLEEVEKEDLHRELPIDVTIASGFPKGEKLELIVQKGQSWVLMTLSLFLARARWRNGMQRSSRKSSSA